MSTTTWEPVLTLPITPGRDHVLGPVDAPLTMVEYGDYECPFCRMAYPEVADVVERMGEELCFAYRHFPLTTVHPHAVRAAEAAEAAGAQGRFWEMHALLFAEQDRLDAPSIVLRAERLGLDVERFVAEVRDQVHAPKVQSDFLSGVRSGVQGTPTFFVNGRRHEGPADARSLLHSLELALPRA